MKDGLGCAATERCLLMCKHLIKGVCLGRFRATTVLCAPFPVSETVIHGRGGGEGGREGERDRARNGEGGGDGKSQGEHMFASVWSLKAPPDGCRSGAFVSRSPLLRHSCRPRGGAGCLR